MVFVVCHVIPSSSAGPRAFLVQLRRSLACALCSGRRRGYAAFAMSTYRTLLVNTEEQMLQDIACGFDVDAWAPALIMRQETWRVPYPGARDPTYPCAELKNTTVH